MSDARVEQIRTLNDRFRRSFSGGQVLVTKGVGVFGPDRVAEILRKVRAFDAFTQANDPYDEHDMGSFIEGQYNILWKIDYYAPDLQHGSDDPADESRTCRVLTIMMADEY